MVGVPSLAESTEATWARSFLSERSPMRRAASQRTVGPPSASDRTKPVITAITTRKLM